MSLFLYFCFEIIAQMGQELSQQQTLIQTQTQTLAPQQLLVVRLLELPVTDLEGRQCLSLRLNESLLL